MKLSPGTIVSGEYRILHVLGEGGFGSVYEAEQLSTSKRRALKVLHPHYVSDPQSRLRFVEEAKVGGRIDSEHVVEVIGAGADESRGIAWLAMELLEGVDLFAHVQSHGPLAPDAVRELFLQLSHALGAAHARGIVHRDLKPENIFLAKAKRRGATMTVKVLDFGLAKSLEASRTVATATAAIGSPLFMAPEQASVGAPIRAATDVWALGLIAFFALTGQYYWRSAASAQLNMQALMAEMLVHPIDPPSQRARDLGIAGSLPAGFDAWFARCVVRDATQRFSSADECVRALDAQLSRHHAGHAATAAVAAHRSAPAIAATAAMPGSTPTAPYGGVTSDGISGPAPSAAPGVRAPRLLQVGLGLGGLLLAASLATTGYLLLTRPDAPSPLSQRHGPSPAPGPTPLAVPVPDPTPGAPDPAATAPAPAEPEAPGTIYVTARGGTVDIALDGTPVGRTPLQLRAVPGPHTLEASTEGAEPRTFEVEVRSGQATRMTIPVTRTPVPAPSETGSGWLSINTNPWSTVYVDGRRIGNTPVLRHSLPAGQHRLRLVNSDLGISRTDVVTIRSGQTTTRTLRLQP